MLAWNTHFVPDKTPRNIDSTLVRFSLKLKDHGPWDHKVEEDFNDMANSSFILQKRCH